MRWLLSLTACLLSTILPAQPREKYAADAFVIMRMAQKFHVQPRTVDESLSVRFFDHFFEEADEARIIFTTEDMSRLLPYRTRLSEEVKMQQTGFLRLVTEMYENRIRRIDSLLATLQKQPFSFIADEKLAVAEDTAYVPVTQVQQKLVKLVKREMLEYFFETIDEMDDTNIAGRKKQIDSLEPEARKKIITRFQRGIKRMQDGMNGIPTSMGNLYCGSLAAAFDPHSAYMPRTEKENFESGIGGKSMRFGFSLSTEGDEEGVSLNELKPGSPAYKSGQLNKGDKIMGIQWEGKKEIDVSEASPAEVSALLGESNYGKVILTVKKADGLLRKVELVKETMETDDDEYRVKIFLLKNDKHSIGYLSLPAFYTDFDDPQNNVKGCANDVAKAILRLKKENITGLVLDLRYNGGGSMQEAVDLSGIFIDAGPVGQASTTGGKVYTLKDVNRGTIYDGPLLLLVNGASASASEMVAGTLQDYHRAVIMGTPTYGKATSQVIMPLDSLTKPDVFNRNSLSQTFLKLTIGKLYRITGISAQGEGVVPDIQLPDIAASLIPHESDAPNYLKVEAIPANRFYTPYGGEGLSAFVYTGRKMIDTSAWYQEVKKNATLMKGATIKKDISLKWQDALAQWEKYRAIGEKIEESVYDSEGMFNIQNTADEEKRLQLSPGMKELNEQLKTALRKDAWIATAFKILSVTK